MRNFLPFRSLGTLATLSFLWLLNFGARAQTFDWATATHSLPPGSTARSFKTAFDAFGNTYIVGNFTGNVAFGATTLTGNGFISAAFVAKLDSSGNWLWAKQTGGTGGVAGAGVAVDGSGNVLLTGTFAGATVIFGATTLTNSGSNDVFVAKLDGNGNWLWARKAGGTGGEGGTGVAVDGRGNVLLTGFFQSPTATFGITTLTNSGGIDVFVAKLDGDGNWLWAKQAGGTGGDSGRGAAVDGSGNVLLAGNFTGNVVFGTIALTSNGFEDVFVAKLDSSGDWLWAKKAGGAGGDINTDLAVDGSGNVLLTGFSQSPTVRFGITTLTNSTGSEQVFVARLDGNGSWLWARQAGGAGVDGGYGVAVDGSGNVLLTGTFQSPTATFRATTLTNSSNGFEDVFVARLDGNGNWLWARQAGGTGLDGGTSVAVDGSGNVLLTGFFQSSTAAFGSTTLTNSTGSDQVFVARLRGAGSPTALAPSATAPAARLAPNPAHTATHLTGAPSHIPLTLLDALGRTVLTATTDAQGAATLPVRGLPAGLYLLRGAGPARRLVVE